MSAFERVCEPLVEAISEGLSLEEACATLEIPANTVRGWLRKGRLDPDGPYGPFAHSLDATRADRADAERDLCGPLTLDEFERLVADLARRGSVQALKLWSDRHPIDAADAPVDQFARFDELARRRAARGA
jgi:hypothetical protein